MKKTLVEQWLQATKPHGILELKEDLASSFGKTVTDPESRAKVMAAINSLEESKILEIWKTFAEEIFSDDALEASVKFFTSPIGMKYRDERVLVTKATMNATNKYVTGVINKMFE